MSASCKIGRHLHAADLLQPGADFLSVFAGIAHACVDIDGGYGNFHRLLSSGRLRFIILCRAALRHLLALHRGLFGCSAAAGFAGAKGQYNGERQHDRRGSPHCLSEYSSLHKDILLAGLMCWFECADLHRSKSADLNIFTAFRIFRKPVELILSPGRDD